MAVEVRAQAFNFITPNEFNPLQRANKKKITRNIHAKVQPRPSRKVDVAHTWFYNPLHDMESILWLILYFTTNKDVFLGPSIDRENPYVFVQETDEELRRRIMGHWNLALTLFSSRSGRDRIMLANGALADHLSSSPLHPSIEPLAAIIAELRDNLAATYRKIESNPPSINHESGAEIHEAFKGSLEEAYDHLLTVPFDVQVRSLRGAVERLPQSSSTAHASIGSKRVRDQDEEDGRPTKSQRVSVEQRSPSPAASAGDQREESVHETKVVVPPPTRVLRSHSRKAAAEAKTPLSPPRTVPRSRKVAAPNARKGNATKNHEAAKAAAKVAATKTRSRTRKGR